MVDQISELTISRLSLYLRLLNELESKGVKTVSSKELAQAFDLNAALIRKDLAHFGDLCVRGLGYNFPSKVGRESRRGVSIYDIRELKKIAHRDDIGIAAVAVPEKSAQNVVNTVVEAGIRAVLNFSPGALRVPAHVKLKSVDLTVSLEGLSFYLAREAKGIGDV